MGYSMRASRYRFTVWVDRADASAPDAVELYDHQSDPQEDVNIAGQAATVERPMAQWRLGWRGALPALSRQGVEVDSAAAAGKRGEGGIREFDEFHRGPQFTTF